MSLDRDASDRCFDRQLTHLGLLDDAALLFREGDLGARRRDQEGEPCCMSWSPRPATSASAIASCTPHRTRAAQTLCAMLDQTATSFPGSRLRLRFAVRPPSRIGFAVPRIGGRARRRHGRCLGPMNGAKPDTVAPRNVRRSEFFDAA